MSTQLVFDFFDDTVPTFERTVIGHNAELVAALQCLVQTRDGNPLPAAHLYLWGDSGSGRTHLLIATAEFAQRHARPVHYFAAEHFAGEALPETPEAILLLDDVQRAPPGLQHALFNAYNRARELKQRLVVSGDAPPLRLALREDLRTRIGQSLVFHVEPLDDAQRLGFLQQWAQARGMRLERDVATYVLHRIERDPRRLAAFVAALDRRSLERQRPVTVALAREVLAELEAEPLRDESGLSNKE
ncbi:HdaA/DnaA family protein [Tepidiphilus thermophilus]|uniref:Regulatory inactivation of DnaA Hda protein n=1 Tax=Tepidiphilus thermophilus TaxID=876478 RepID=A0A0K6IQI1_9PROT|nr:DnaA/Hda family protein [Tepidiphilus thermophilus]CUB05349.1 regulatory inactivation of DnaA Hda protein [Tepidiphilus thermophilus]